jgi:hypothetical protein
MYTGRPWYWLSARMAAPPRSGPAGTARRSNCHPGTSDSERSAQAWTGQGGRPSASVFLGTHQAHHVNMAAAQRFQVHPMFHAHLNTAGHG